jgi:adenosylcobinamide-phosphate synthase
MVLNAALVAAFMLDLVLGDPLWSWHPVRLMGRLIQALEAPLRKQLAPRWAGLALVLIMVVVSAGSGLALLALAWRLGGWIAAMIVEALLIYFCLSSRDLLDHALAVAKALDAYDMPKARAAVARMVGRDTQHLDSQEISRAALESVAESTCDGVVAPLFFALLGGAPLCLAFKAVSTLDSMVGYKNERYLEYGWASAKLDDALNYGPARLSAFLASLGAWFLALDSRAALHCARHDGPQQPSPNSGWPEGAFAGALGVQLGGLNHYQGMAVQKPLLGEPLRPLGAPALRLGAGLMLVSGMIALGAGVMLRTLLFWGLGWH